MTDQQMSLSMGAGPSAMVPGQISVSHFDNSVLEINKQHEDDEIRELESKVKQLQQQKQMLEEQRQQELASVQKYSIENLKVNFEKNNRDIEIYQQKIQRYMDATKKEVGDIVVQNSVLTPLSLGIALSTIGLIVYQMFESVF